MKNFALSVLALFLLFGAYELHSIASTDIHNAYCSQISNAASNYLASPYLSKSEFKQAEGPFLAVLKRGAKYPQVPTPTGLVIVGKAILSANSTDSAGKSLGWDNFVKHLTASYLVANSC